MNCRNFALTLIVSVLSCRIGLAEEAAKATPNKRAAIQWFYPKKGKQLEGKRAEIILSGRAAPGTTISVKGDSIASLSADGKIQQLKAKDTIEQSSVVADDQGYFVIKLALPTGTAQVPVQVGPQQNVQLSLNVQEKKVALANAGTLTASKEYRDGSGVWLGAGLNYMTYSENSGDADIHVHYSSFKGPAFFLEGRYMFSEQWKLLASAKRSPGIARSSDKIAVAGENYNWDIYTLEGQYRGESWKFGLFNRPSVFGIRFGLQQHSMPYLAKASTTEVTLKNYSVSMATVGAQMDTRINHTTNLEVYLSYQYPLMSSSGFKANPGLTFDGSVGVLTMLSPDWSAGVFWNGQYHKYSFKYSDGGSTATGTQQVFFSSLDARVGYTFP